jgi:hypothetical protein
MQMQGNIKLSQENDCSYAVGNVYGTMIIGSGVTFRYKTY